MPHNHINNCLKETNANEIQLSIVMPVYNEAETILSVLKAWLSVVEHLHIDYEFLIYDDGSRDATLHMLTEHAQNLPRLKIHHHANRGHGPTILRGYREARGQWVFQTDSDDEMPAEHFHTLWQLRDQYDFLIGSREHRDSPLPRRMITAISRLTVYLLFGRGVMDVNSPYRLMRRAWLQQVVSQMPEDLFAPNVLLSGLASRHRLRIFTCYVPHQGRRSGQVSLVKWKLWQSAGQAFLQTIKAALVYKERP
jgi:glycosyltransferase involved in cell wall biosynthesis